MNVTVIGAGYVGLSTGVCLAQIGHSVTLVETDDAKIESLRQGKVPHFEPFLEHLIGVNKERLHFTSSFSDSVPNSDVVLLAVGTPLLANGVLGLGCLHDAASQVARHLGTRFTVVVNKSTLPIDGNSALESLIRNAAPPEADFCVAFNPEFLSEGSALHDSLYPDRIVIGTTCPRAIEKLRELYRPIVEQSFPAPEFLPRPQRITSVPVLTTDPATAILIKYAANCFIAARISFINEIAQLAGKSGADIQQVARGMGMDRRIGPLFLNAGVGWGGSCLGRDTSALIAGAAGYELTMPIVEAARESNDRQRELVLQRLIATLKTLQGRTVGLLGVAFKPNTDDIRNAPALDVARILNERGATVKAHDPVALPNARASANAGTIAWCDTVEALAADADALVLLTEWQEYRELDWYTLRTIVRNPLLVDGRYFLDAERLQAAGWQYLRLH